ncbi:hypothetical protein NPIL_174161, partial [Nephila pilipes]
RTYIHSELQEMKRKSSSIDVSSERVCFNDDDDTKVDSSFSDDAVPLHHFHLGQDIYAAVTYFANGVQIHLRQYGRNDNNRLFPTKRGMLDNPREESNKMESSDSIIIGII